MKPVQIGYCGKNRMVGRLGRMARGTGIFALNIDMPDRLGDLAKRQKIGRAILRSINALPLSG